MRNLESIKDDLIEASMSCDLDEAKHFLNAVIGGNQTKLKLWEKYLPENEVKDLKLEIQAAQEILDGFKR